MNPAERFEMKALIIVSIILVFNLQTIGSRAEDSPQEPKDLVVFCKQQYEKTGECPDAVCRLEEEAQSGEEPAPMICLAKDCPEIDPKDCPEDYCALMKDCSEQMICHFQMPGDPAECGDLAYAGQDVPCCPGLVRRCGIEFLDGTCDMEGKNSVYNLPICIPCGNGICSNFENRCNCPEDCGTAPSHGGSQRDLPFAYIKASPAQEE